MEWAVDVRARVGDHLNLADLKLGTWGILGARGLTAQPVADHGRRKSLVRHHSVLDGMAHIDQSSGHHLASPRVTDLHSRGRAATEAWLQNPHVHQRVIIATAIDPIAPKTRRVDQ